MDTKKWINFMLNDIEKTHKENIKKIKDKRFKVKEEENNITFEKECKHVWEYQPREEDTNIHAYQFCIKCDVLDETDYEEENE